MPAKLTLEQIAERCASQLGVAPNTRGREAELKLESKLNAEPNFVRASIGSYLLASGLTSREIGKATNKSLMTAYLVSNYLKSWRNRVNPMWSLLGDDDAFGDEASEADASAADAAGATAAVPPTVPPTVSDAAKPEASEAWLRDLFANMDRTVTRLVKEKVDASVIRLDPDAKREIRDLATSVAEDLASRIARNVVEELMPPRRIEIALAPAAKAIDVGLQHFRFETLLRAASARDHKGNRLNIWLTGPTGSGKTTAAENVAKAFGLPFGCDGSLDADYKVLGFRNAQGEMVSTEFLRIYTGGGVYVADEIDNWLPSALLSLNAALANGFVTTPDGLVRRHPDCIVIACANTWGHGATNEYVGRTKLDAASLDRFHPKIAWPYDEDLERAIASAQWSTLGTAWQNVTSAARAAAASQGLKIIVSPRATYTGLALLQAGFSAVETAEQVIKAGMSEDQYRSLGLTAALARVEQELERLRREATASEAEMSRATSVAYDDNERAAVDAAWGHFDSTPSDFAGSSVL